ncbi:Asp-tRNA(Asn)/Glu-tRNA(Gln) amidotransferase GatCAB subunit B [archaeon SCG-AAA382B04]|nr:Asp-tRNA(Asn)/Glu-tRNA(Gln) amidotransferase GatCAB subunit B [archaeon SCG-AAA382B04]
MNVTIGLEVHVQLLTKSKLFCNCGTNYRDSEPNTHTCPVCLGLPGSLPVLNKKAIEYGTMAGLALNCDIANEMQFHRKNYFYPDLPKGFQITQYDRPLGQNGEIRLDQDKKIRIKRIHLEEDPGRLVHPPSARYSLIDYNRSGVPLLEIVTKPDMDSPQEARSFLKKIRETLEFLDIFDGSLDGAMRCDANISLEGGGRAEVKNISSYKGAEKALSYEITRQKNLLRRGKEVKRETRHFDESQEITRSMREKEQEHDYRYFPEPDLPLIQLTEEKINSIKEKLPELPEEKRKRFLDQYEITKDQAKSLTTSKTLANFFEEISQQVNPKKTATWVTDSLMGELNYRDQSLSESNMNKQKFIYILEKLRDGDITEKGATKIIRHILDEGGHPKEIIKQKDFKAIKSQNLDQIIHKILEKNSEAVEDYIKGKEEAINYLVGQVMSETKGKAKPADTRKKLQKILEGYDG